MADLSITGEVVVTSEKAEGAFDRVGAKAGQMASKVQTEATKAGAAVDGIGTGAEKGAEKFTRAESRMREAIMKSTRELEMLGKTASQKFEAQLDFKGLDKAKFQPVLDDLRKMEEATKRAETGFSGMSTAAQMAGRALAAIGIGASVREFVAMADASTNMASKLALVTGSTAELAQVQRRLFDVAQASRVGFVGLADTYTQFARSTKDLGVSQTALLDITKTISQAITISGGSAASAQAALVQLGQGFASGALRGEELNSVLEQTPRLAQALADGLGVGIGKLREMGSNGELTAEKVLGALQKAAAGIESEFARMTPTIEQSITKITNSMTRLVGEIDKGVGATSKLSSALGLVSGGIDFLAGDISKLNSQGALRAAADEVLRLDGMAKRLRNTMDSGIVGPNAQANLDALMAKLAEAKARFRELDAQLGGAGKDPRDQSGYTTRSQSYANEAKRLEGVQAAMGKVLGNLSGVKDSFFKDLNALYAGYQNGLIKTAEYQQAVANLIRDSGSNKPSAGGKGGDQFAADRDAAQEWARYMKDFSKAAQDASAESDNLTKSQEKLLEFLLSPAYQNASEPMRQLALQSAYAAINQEQANVATKEAAKAAAESSKALGSWYEVREKESQGLQNQINARREEVSMMGMTTEAVIEYTRAKFEQQAAEKEAYAAALESASFYAGEYADAYKTAAEAARQQAAQLRELGGLEVEKANKDAAKKAKDEWERAADDINRSLTDALLRGFESGKGFAENLRDTLKNMFSTLVLRPIISAALSPVAGAVNGFVGNAVGGAAGSGIGSGIATSIGTSAIGSAFSLGLTNFGTGVGSTLANGVFGGIGTNISNFGTLAGAGNFSGALGVAAPYLAGIGAIYAIAKSLDDSGTYHTGGAAQYNAATGLTSGPSGADYGIGFGQVEAGASTISAVGSVAQGLGSALDAMAKSFGKKAGYEVATAFADDTSKDGAWGALRISKDGMDLLNWENTRQSKWAPREFGDGEAGYKEYLAAVAKDTRQVLLDMDLPSWADKMLKSIGDNASMDQLQAVITQIGVVQSAFMSLGKSMEMFSGLTDDMQAALLKASGSVDALLANAGAFYEGFYSEKERFDSLSKQLRDSLGQLDLSIDPALGESAKAQFRGAVENAFAAGNAELAAQLLALSGNFATAADYFAQPAKERAEQEKKALESLSKEQASLWADLAEAQGELATAAERRYLLETQGMTDAEKAAYTYNKALKDQVAVAQQFAKVMTELSSSRFDLENQLLTQSGLGKVAQQRTDQRDLAELTKGLPEEQAAKVREQFEANLKLRDQYEANQLAADNLAAAMGQLKEQQDAATQAQKDMLQSTVTSAKQAVDDLRSIFDFVGDAIKELRGDVVSTAGMQAEQARAFIQRASVLMRSGTVVDSGQLQAAIRTASGSVQTGAYASQFEADNARLVLANELAGLQDGTAGQLTVAEKHLSVAEQQLNALNVIAASINSLASAQAVAAGQPRDQWARVQGQDVYASSGGAVGINTGSGIDIYGKDGSRFTGGEAIAFVRNQLAANEEASVYAAAVRTGISSKALDELMGWAAGTSNDWAKANGLPQFAIGTNYVPRDMVAQIHEGEAIVPKAFNPWANGVTSGNTQATERLLQQLVADNRVQAREIVRLNTRIAKLMERWDGEGLPQARSEAAV